MSLARSSGGGFGATLLLMGGEGWFVGGEGVKWKDDTTVIEVGG